MLTREWARVKGAKSLRARTDLLTYSCVMTRCVSAAKARRESFFDGPGHGAPSSAANACSSKLLHGSCTDSLSVRTPCAKAGLLDLIDPVVWLTDRVVDTSAVGDGRAALKHLAPYIFRVDISDQRILACTDGKVTLRTAGSAGRRPTFETRPHARDFARASFASASLRRSRVTT
jgi:hypothetical protein